MYGKYAYCAFHAILQWLSFKLLRWMEYVDQSAVFYSRLRLINIGGSDYGSWAVKMFENVERYNPLIFYLLIVLERVTLLYAYRMYTLLHPGLYACYLTQGRTGQANNLASLIGLSPGHLPGWRSSFLLLSRSLQPKSRYFSLYIFFQMY